MKKVFLKFAKWIAMKKPTFSKFNAFFSATWQNGEPWIDILIVFERSDGLSLYGGLQNMTCIRAKTNMKEFLIDSLLRPAFK